MDLEKISEILKILHFIHMKDIVTFSEIEEITKINQKTLYRYINRWEREGYVKKDKERNKKGIKYLRICANPKLNEIRELMKDLISNHNKSL